LVRFEKELNIVDPEQRVTIQTARLAQLNTDFTAAQAERVRREAILAQVTASPNLASAQAAQAAAQDNGLSDALRQLYTVRQQFASVRSYYGENNPQYIKAKQQVDEAQAQVDELRGRTGDRASAEYKEALGREARLRGLVQETKTEVDELKARAYQYEQLKSDAANDKKIYEDLAARARIAGINQQFRSAAIQIAAQALPPQAAISPKLSINLSVAVLLSGILGIFTAVLADALRTTVSDPEEVANQLGVDVLASIPDAKHLPKVVTSSRPEAFDLSKQAAMLTRWHQEAIRDLRTTLTLLFRDRPVRSLLVTSALPGEGKSTTTAHLAMACAQIGKRVLMVDADLRRPTLHKQFGVLNRMGLSGVLAGEAPLSQAAIERAIIPLDQPGLFLMPAGWTGPQHAGDLISMGFAGVLDRVSRDFDLVIVDSPSVLGIAESRELAATVDGTIVVAKAESTSWKALSEAISSLVRSRANVMGVVMNQVKSSSVDYGHNYSHESVNETPFQLKA
jgi:capsular exopolysaccharide synthesis family protein